LVNPPLKVNLAKSRKLSQSFIKRFRAFLVNLYRLFPFTVDAASTAQLWKTCANARVSGLKNKWCFYLLSNFKVSFSSLIIKSVSFFYTCKVLTRNAFLNSVNESSCKNNIAHFHDSYLLTYNCLTYCN